MSLATDYTSRRRFLKSACLLPAVAKSLVALAQIDKAKIPFVDGLCSLTWASPGDRTASGLSGVISDVSGVERVTQSDGSTAFRRTYDATTRSIVGTRQALRENPDVFLATNGTEIKEAFLNGKSAVFLQIQGGGEIVGDDLSRIDLLKELGLRILQITHHHNNPLGGGALERELSGLTELGHEAIERMNALGVIPDLSHASDQTAIDTLNTSDKPVILSHGAARALVNNGRCVPDEVIRGIAESGGVMGIFMMSFWLTTDPVPTVGSFLKQIQHVINVGGIDSVGIANDFPLAGIRGLINSNNSEVVKNYFRWWDSIAELGVLGFDKRPVHVAIPELNNIHRMHTIQDALEKRGHTSSDVEKIMGGNWIRALSES